MILLYLLNMVLYVSTPLIVPVYMSRRFQLGRWNLLTIPILVGIPIGAVTSFSGPYFFLDGSLLNPFFQYALLVNNVYVSMQAATLIFIVSRLQIDSALSRYLNGLALSGGVAKPKRMRWASVVFMVLFLLSFLLLTQSFGLVNWLLNPRTGYQLHRTGEGQWYAFCLTFLSVSLVLATAYARSSHKIVLLAPIYLYLANLLGSKGIVSNFAVYLVIILAIRHYKYLNVVSLIVGIGGAALIISTFVSALGGFGIQEISQYSDYYVNAAVYYKSYLNGSLPLYHGDIFLSSFWNLVPRGLYPDKPYVYGITKVTDVFFPGAAALTNTPAFATVDYFADFGWLQVIIWAILDPFNLLQALLYSIVLPRLGLLNPGNRSTHSRVFTYSFLLAAAPSFLVFFSFPFNAILFFVIISVINLSNKVRFGPNASLNDNQNEALSVG